MLGFWVTGHPLDRYADKIAELATHDSGNLEGLAKSAEVALCGVLTGITRKRNKEGKPWAAMTIEDRNGSVEAHGLRQPATSAWRRRSWKTRRCWCAAWCCPKRTRRPRFRCRTSWRWITRASICRA